MFLYAINNQIFAQSVYNRIFVITFETFIRTQKVNFVALNNT